MHFCHKRFLCGFHAISFFFSQQFQAFSSSHLPTNTSLHHPCPPIFQSKYSLFHSLLEVVHLSKVNIASLFFHVRLPTNFPNQHPSRPIFPSKLLPFQSLHGAKQQKFSVHVVFRFVCFFQQQARTEKLCATKTTRRIAAKHEKVLSFQQGQKVWRASILVNKVYLSSSNVKKKQKKNFFRQLFSVHEISQKNKRPGKSIKKGSKA